jgi:diadenosine tetraphosphate (Ap4A) HIT family hydrolase
MPNATALKFGYPDTVLAEQGSWIVQLRPKQVTLGALVLVCREPATAFSHISAEAFAALKPVSAAIEQMLGAVVGYQRINYLMLMMVDPDVHFHVLPRYEGHRSLGDFEVADAGWPGPPNLGIAADPSLEQRAALIAALRAAWPAWPVVR